MTRLEAKKFLERINLNSFLEFRQKVEAAIAANSRVTFAHHNLHSLYLLTQYPELSRFYQMAQYTYVDGMGLVGFSHLVGHPLKRSQRMTMVDYLYDFLHLAEIKQWNIFYLGSDEKSLSMGLLKLKRRFPKLNLQGHCGFFSPEQNQAILDSIEKHKAHVLLVGMGMPDQENWIFRNRCQLSTNIVLPVGGLLDYFSGKELVPPRWAGPLGLEWFFRFIFSPKRLFSRYFIEPVLLLYEFFRR